MIGHSTQPAYSLATREASFYFLCKCNTSTRLLMRLTKGIRWESVCLKVPCVYNENLVGHQKQIVYFLIEH